MKSSCLQFLSIIFLVIFFQTDINAQLGGTNLNLLYAQPSTSLHPTKSGDLNFAVGGGPPILTEVAYSPLPNISLQANYLNYKIVGNASGVNLSTTDNIVKFGIGTYYFMNLKRLRNRKETITDKIGMRRGFLFDANISYGTGTKKATIYDSTHNSKFNIIASEVGIHYFGKILSLHFSINRNLFIYTKYVANGNSPDPILSVADLLENDKSFDIFTFSQRITFGTKQIRAYIATNTPLINKGDVDFIQNKTAETFRPIEVNFGLILNINSIFKTDFSLTNPLSKNQ